MLVRAQKKSLAALFKKEGIGQPKFPNSFYISG